MKNPYDWQSHHPSVEIPRAALEQVVETLLHGGSTVVLGGRGMGKSVFLRQLQTALERAGDTRVFLIAAPPADLTVQACLGNLARRLGAPEKDYFGSMEIAEAYFARDDRPKRLVLLFDEFDRYAEPSAGRRSNPPGRGFFNDLEATRRDFPELGFLATGSLGVFVVRDVLGSSFLGRALRLHLTPFDADAVRTLARPFAERGNALEDDVLLALRLATGGIPALLTYGFQQLWKRRPEPVERDIAELFAVFRRDHDDYLRDLLRSVADPHFSAAPLRVLERIREVSGPVSRAELEEALSHSVPTGGSRGESAGSLDLSLVDVLHLLEAAGLVRVEGSIHADDPVVAHPIASVLNLPQSSPPSNSLSERFFRDLTTLLEKLQRAGADFFRPGRGGEGKTLVPESVFAAHLALGFELLGWRTEREAQSAAGRTDVKLRRNASPEVMIVEVKIWGRNDYREAQRQIESYWAADVAGGAVVQITDSEVHDWKAQYRTKCLDAPVLESDLETLSGSPIHARFRCSSTVAGGMTARIDHFLLRLPRRSGP